MKKITIVVIVIMLIVNFIVPCINVYATTDPPTEPDPTTEPAPNSDIDIEASLSGDDSIMMSLDRERELDSGKANIDGNETNIKLGDSDVGSFGSKCASFISTIAGVCAKVISNIAADGGLVYGDSIYSVEEKGLFTINSLVFGEYFLFNSTPYEKSTDVIQNNSVSGIVKVMDNMKEMGAGLGRFIVKVGVAVSLPLFLVSLLNTFRARNANDVAAWKKILVRWILCIALIFFFHYILIAIDSVSEVCTETLWKMRVGLEENDFRSFEVEVEEDVMKSLEETGGVTSLGYAIEFLIIVVLQMIFFVKYFIRAFARIFLFVIAPFIFVKHSFSLMLGNESDTLGAFFKYYIILSFMMPFHALIYFIFILSMSELAINIPIIGMFLLYAILRAGNIVRAMFGFEMGSSILGAKE